MIATTSKSDRNIDSTEPGLVMDWLLWARAVPQRKRGSRAQPLEIKVNLPEFFNSLNLTNNISEPDTKFVVNHYYFTMSNQRAIY